VTAGIDRKRVFDAARAGDADTVRRALADGFDPGSTDDDGRTIHQIAKTGGHRAIELLAREFQEQSTRPAASSRRSTPSSRPPSMAAPRSSHDCSMPVPS
jgi:ankyrin repeat protein